MAFPLTTVLAVLIPLLALFYQFILSDILFVAYGVNRHLQPLSDFPYTCRKIIDPQIEACEDMWLDETSRTLYLACSDAISRTKWMPNINKFNAEARPHTDHIVALNIDAPTPAGGFEYTILKPKSYTGAGGESALYLVGMTGRPSSTTPNAVDLYLISAQPSFHANGTIKDQPSAGGNSTIEIFTTVPGTDEMTHTRTFFDPQIATPNNVAVLPDGSFYFTNDHGLSRSGVMHDLSTLLRTGDVSFCAAPIPSSSNPNPILCKKVAGGIAFPNGLHYSARQNKLFVPSAALGHIYVYAPQPNGDLTFLERVTLPYPIDNLSEDKDGSIIAAVLPKSGEIFQKFVDQDPYNELPVHVARDRKFGSDLRWKIAKEPASAAFVVRRVGRGEHGENWEVKKLIEDRDGAVLPASTTVIRDAKTGRLWFVGVVSEWISWCEGK